MSDMLEKTDRTSDLKTDPELLEKLKKAAGMPQSAEDIMKQRVSFIMGAIGEKKNISREHVEKVIRQREGS